MWYVQERFEDPEVVYIERDLPANGAHAGADAKAEAAPSGLASLTTRALPPRYCWLQKFQETILCGCKAGTWQDLKTMCCFMCISKHRGVGFVPNHIRLWVFNNVTVGGSNLRCWDFYIPQILGCR